jgi:pyridoxal phosphate enzyme (YggS family)
MPTSPSRAAALVANLNAVAARIAAASAAYTANNSNNAVRLVAVSKLKPASDILALHAPPTAHLHFGENYLQELLEKSKTLPPEIRWHFMGGLQSNKCVTLARDVRGLWAVESVDTEKKASLLDKGWTERWAKLRQEDTASPAPDYDDDEGVERLLRVFVQVNTSGEEAKSGVEPGEPAVTLCRFIQDKCPRLKLQGLMTIGAIARSKATSPGFENEDFLCLRETRDLVQKELDIGAEDDQLELSMGMSEDFEGAIALGSNQVRVGSTIFGVRPPKAAKQAP